MRKSSGLNIGIAHKLGFKKILAPQSKIQPTRPAHFFPHVTDSEMAQAYMLGSFHPALEKIYRKIGKVLDNRIPLLLQGERGVGKETLVRVIHRASKFRLDRFVMVPGHSVTVDEFELAVYGSSREHLAGEAPQADEGVTVFLKNVDALPVMMQARLLRLLQEKSVSHPQTHAAKKIVLRVLATTQKNLEHEVAAGKFRRDLYYRLTIEEFTLPPLRERKDDFQHFAHHFLQNYAATVGEPPARVTYRALAALRDYQWPGNLHEFKQVIWHSALNRSHIATVDEIIWPNGHNEKAKPPATHAQADASASTASAAIPENEFFAATVSTATASDHRKNNHPQFV